METEYLGFDTDIESFPFPETITRADFLGVADFDPDAFLFKHHRYTALDSLLSELTNLSRTLNQDLLDLVNNEYASFIELGRSIDSCLELMNNIQLDVGRFKSSVKQTTDDFSKSRALTEAVLQHKQDLSLLKNRTKLVLLLAEQCDSFEQLLGMENLAQAGKPLERKPTTAPTKTATGPALTPVHVKLATLLTLYLSLTKVYAILMEAHEDSDAVCVFFEKTVRPRVVSIKVEFRQYLLELMLAARTLDGDLVLKLLQIHRVTGIPLR